MKPLSSISNAKLGLVSLGLLVALTGCKSNGSSAEDPLANVKRIDYSCQQNVTRMDASLANTAQPAQYATMAKMLEQCWQGVPLSNYHPDAQLGMQLMASSFLYAIQAGDSEKALNVLTQFETSFNGADLYFADYTSFIDTANALLGMAQPSNLSNLNINADLRQELERQSYWLQH